MKKKTQHTILAIAICVAFIFVVIGAWMILKSGMRKTTNKANVEWYDENGTEFVITTADELYGVVALSDFYNFEGQTIKLGADIVVNEGDASEWAKKTPARKWYPITGFKGTFDGQGHTISGIYGKSVDSGMGLFSNTQRGCVIRDFRLLNSYFSGSSEGTGGISSHGGGTFDTIYTDAIIATNYSYAGGIIGQVSASGEHKISNCWFDGSITMKSEEGIYGGGIAGAISGEGGIITIEHTLNTGTISAEGSSRAVDVGGFCGSTDKGAVLNVTDSLNAGIVQAAYDKLVGGVIGDIKSGSKITVSHMYSTQESYIKAIGYQAGSVTGMPVVYPYEYIEGYGGYQWTTLDFENYWAVDVDATPVLKAFTNDIPSVAGIEKNYDIDWYDAFGTEFTISTLQEFYGFYILSANDNFEGKMVKLGADLVVNEGKASSWAKNAPENPWYPINTFAGIFDGQGYTISGVYVKGNSQKMGLFAETTSAASVQNLNLKNSYFEFTDTTMALLGSIAGRGNGMFDTIYSDAILVCSGTGCGGIVGQVNVAGAQISNCWYDGEIQMKGETGRQIGGILGITRAEVDIDHCLNTSKITAESKGGIRAAGILGIATGGEFTLRITDCLSAGRIYAANSRIGAAVGEIQAGKTAIIRDVYAISESLSADEGKTFINKAIGHVAPEEPGDEKTDPVPAAIVDGSAVMIPEAGIKGYLGYQWTTLNFDKFWSVVAKGTPILTSFAESSPKVAGVKKKIDTSWYKEDAKSYTIKTPEQLNGFFIVSALTNFEGKTVKLGNNITVNAGNAADWATNRPTDMWYPINTFAGTFDGQGHTISGLYLKSATQMIGMFSQTTPTAVVKNFRLTNSYMESTSTGMALLGSIAGRGDGTFDTIYSDAIIVCSGTGCGGIVGQVYTEGKNRITNCWYDGTMSLTTNMGKQAGGILGIAREGVTISHCLNTANIAVEATGGLRVAGILGIMTGGEPYTVTVNDCLSAGNITAVNSRVGAVVAEVQADKKLIMKDVYASVEGLTTGKAYIKKTIGHVDETGKTEGMAALIPVALLNGTGGYQWTTLDFAKYWGSKVDKTPELLSFTSGENLSVSGLAKKSVISWYDANENTYVIDSVEDLYGFYIMSFVTNFKDKTVKLGANLTVNTGGVDDWSTEAPENVWYPVNSFAGTFDGQGHSISGLYLKSSEQMIGFFSQTTGTSIVKNLKLTNSYMESTSTGMALLGSIAGRGNGTFDTIYSDTTIVCSGTGCGGIVGQVYAEGSNKITNCWYDGKMSLTTDMGKQAGGILGIARAGVAIEHCLSTANITVEATGGLRVAGILGIATGGEFTLRMTDCLSAGRIYAANSRTGAVAGEIQTGKTAIIRDVYAISESLSADGGKTYINKPIGHVDPEAIADGSGVMIPEAGITGYLGYQWTTLNFDEFWSVDLKDTPVLTSFAKSSPKVAGVKKKIDISWYNEDAKTYTIKTAEQLNGFFIVSALTDFEGKTVKLGKDITVNAGNATDWATKAPENMWYPINTFVGTFDGQGHTISGLYLKSATQAIGLFGETTPKAVVKNLKLTNSYMESTSTGMALLGSIAGRGDGTFDTIYSDAVIVCSGTGCGGIVGQVYTEGNNKITNCWYDGQMSIKTDMGKQAGGILGIARAGVTIEHCLNTADIDVEATAALRVAGILGIMTGGEPYTVTISDCLSAGNIITENSRVGAIVGEVQSEKELVLNDVYASAEGLSTGQTYIKKEFGHIDNTDTVKGAAALVPSSLLEGTNGYQWTSLDFAKYWGAKADKTPELLSFTSGKNLRVTGLTKESDISWYSLNANEYEIDSVKDLYGFYIMSISTNFKDKTVKLGADLDVNTGDAASWATKAPENVWYPINTFAGTFDGQEHRISGLYLKSSNQMIGFISQMDSTAVVKNLEITNSYMESTSTGMALLGSIAGRGNGTFDTVYSNAILVSSGTGNGGLVGQTYYKDTKINNAWFDGSITLTTEMGVQAGGIVGIARESISFNDCLNTGTITAESTGGLRVSGILGIMTGGKFAVEMNNCLTAGKITAADARVGVVIGEVQEGKTLTLNEVYATAESHYTGAKYITRAVGHSEGTINGTGVIVPESSFTGSGAYLWTTFDFENVWAAKADSTPELLSFTTGANLPVVGGMRADTSWYEKGDYNLATTEELYGFVKLSWLHDFNGITVTLGEKEAKKEFTLNGGSSSDWADGLNIPANQWISIGSEEKPFAGTFDGQNNIISGVYMQTVGKYAGLFAKVTGTVQNLHLTNSYFGFNGEKDGWIGSVVGSLCGTLNTVSSDAIVYSNGLYTGGIVGAVQSDALLSTCWFSGSVELEKDQCQYAAGIIGQVGAGSDDIVKMEHCLNTGTITGERTDSTILGLSGLCSYVYSGKLEIFDSLHTGRIGGEGTRRVYLVARGETLVSCENTYYSNEQKLDHAVWGDECTKDNGTKGVSAGTLNGVIAKLNGVELNEQYWIYPEGEAPQLKAFSILENEVLNWEGEGTEASPWIIATKDDIIRLSTLAQTYDFSNRFIQLGTDAQKGKLVITINEGATVDEVKAYAVGENSTGNWTPIGSESLPFAGTFNGNGNTISGLYYKGSDTYVGLFGCIANSSTIKNLKLSNTCYFESENSNVSTRIGSVAGCVQGTLDTIKSEATVVSVGHENGGIAGAVYYSGAASTSVKEVKFTNVWFAGTLTMTTAVGRMSGGIVGKIYAPNRDIVMEHCLVTGTITAARTDSNSQLGGVIGQANAYRKLTISDSLVASVIQNANSDTGAIIGAVDDTDSYTLQNVYGVDGKSVDGKTYEHGITGTNKPGTMSSESRNHGVFDIKTMRGISAKLNGAELNETYWTYPQGEMPQLKAFSTLETEVLNWEGEGTEASPWIIATKDDLTRLSTLAQTYNFSNRFIQLGTDEQKGNLTITINEGATVDEVRAYAVGENGTGNWIPIGSESLPFAGTFNGNGNTISGLYYKGNGTYVGLFGCTANSSTIKNLKLSNTCYFESENSNATARIGSVAGCVQGTLDTIKSEATVVSVGHENGGIAGAVNYPGAASTNVKEVKFTNVWFAGTLTMPTAVGRMSGGIVGKIYALNRDIVMEHCVVTGTITAARTVSNAQLGGIIGQANAFRALTISDSLVASVIQNVNSDTGAIIGTVNGSIAYTLQNVYGVDGKGVNGTTYDHGITGTNVPGAMSSDSSNYGILDISTINGYDGWYNTTLDFDAYWNAIEGKTPELKSFSQSTALPVWAGKGTKASPWIITTKDELIRLSTLAQTYNFSNRFIQLGTDAQKGKLVITINEGATVDEVKAYAVGENGTGNWTPMGSASVPFAGTFNGNNNTISGLYYKGSDTYVGLFGCIANSSTIKNLKLSNTCYFESENSNVSTRIGSVAGCVQGTLDTIKSEATVVSVGHENGGIAGAVYYSGAASTSVKEVKFTNVWFAGTLTMTTAVGRMSGGIVGKIYAPNRDIVMEHCLVTGTIAAARNVSLSQLGGIIGQANAYRKLTISDSLVASVIQNVNSDTGAIIGAVDDTDAYTLQNVYGVDGTAFNGTTYDHGITGTNKQGTVKVGSVYGIVDIAKFATESATTLLPGLSIGTTKDDYWTDVSGSTPILKCFPN